MNRQWTRIILLVLFLAPCAVAQQQSPAKSAPGSQKPKVITRVYDLRDLLQDFAARGGTSKLLPPTRIGGSKPPAFEGPGGGEPLFGGQPKQKPAAVAPTNLEDEMVKL